MRNLCDTIFCMKLNVLQDFHIRMSVPLIVWVQRFLKVIYAICLKI